MRPPAILTPLVTSLVLFGPAAPAVADPPEPPDVAGESFGVIGDGSVQLFFDPTTDTIRVRVDGNVAGATQIAGTWSLVIAGTRNGLPFSEPVWTSAAPTITGHNVYVPRLTPVGEFTVDWAYTGVGGYVVVHHVHQIAWTPMTGNVTAGSGAG